jgi:hypothetical protein
VSGHEINKLKCSYHSEKNQSLRSHTISSPRGFPCHSNAVKSKLVEARGRQDLVKLDGTCEGFCALGFLGKISFCLSVVKICADAPGVNEA